MEGFVRRHRLYKPKDAEKLGARAAVEAAFNISRRRDMLGAGSRGIARRSASSKRASAAASEYGRGP